MTFSSFGTNGTKYTFIMEPVQLNRPSVLRPKSEQDDDAVDGDLNLVIKLKNASDENVVMTEQSLPGVGTGTESPNQDDVMYSLDFDWHALPPENNRGALTLTPIGTDGTLWNATVSESINNNSFIRKTPNRNSVWSFFGSLLNVGI